MSHDDEFRATQARHWSAVDADHFHWQTTGPAFAAYEASLLAPVRAGFATPYLEIGCGEGANFVHVGGQGLRFGIDAFLQKLRFAATAMPDLRLAAADAARLPFPDARMRCVLIRDVLHHVPSPADVVVEAVRVLAPGGRLFVVEPNGRNPMIAAQARLVAAEAGLRASRADALEGLLRAQPLVDLSLRMAEPLPLRRLVLHPRFGLPSLGRLRPVARTLDAVDDLAARVLPRARWGYVVCAARRA